MEKHEDAKAVANWQNDWLSILGIHKGLTGLAKDFALNYLGRSAYHDNNGPLLNSIKKVGKVYPKKQERQYHDNHDKYTIHPNELKKVREAILGGVIVEGRKLFERGGSISDMLESLQTLLSNANIAKEFDLALTENPKVKKAFEFLTGDVPGYEGDHDEL